MEPALTNKSALSFGRYLKNARLERGIHLKKVAISTRIGMDNLLAIEREDHDRLPAEVFVKGFIRSYAKSVGADGDAAVQLYLSSCRIFQETARAEADLKKTSSNFWPRLLIPLGLLLGMITLSVFLMSLPYKGDAKKANVKPPAAEKDSTAVTPEPPEQKSAPAILPPVKAHEKWLLKIVTVEKTWLKVTIDNRKSIEYSLNPGDRLELEALSQFNLLIGNAAGIQLNLNDKDLPVPGKKGQVVTLKIP